MDTQQREIFRCSQCRMEYYADGFNVDRLGRRRKGCKRCSDLNRAYRSRQRHVRGKPAPAPAPAPTWLNDAEIDAILDAVL